MQPSLFSTIEAVGSTTGRRWLLDPRSEEVLATFRTARAATAAHPNTVAREVSQLRALVRSSQTLSGPCTLESLFADLARVASALMIPTLPISLSTGRARLLAAQQFIRFASMTSGRDAAQALQSLDRLLPAKQVVSWHATGVSVGGTASRRRRRAPTLSPSELELLIVAAGRDKEPQRALRDQALVALLCFTGIRAEELMQLRWEDVVRVIAPPGRTAFALNIVRRESSVQLPVLGPAGDALDSLAKARIHAPSTLAGPIFRPANRSERALGYRAARFILLAACRDAGLPNVESSDLRAACAYWLRAGGLSDHEIAATLGLRWVSSVDDLLERHVALDAQRQARHAIDR